MGRFLPPDLHAQAPLARRVAPVARHDARQGGELDGGRLGPEVGGDQGRAGELSGEERQVRGAAHPRVGGRSGDIGAGHAQRAEDRAGHPAPQRHPRRLLDHAADDVEARVRVDAPLPGGRHGLARVQGQPRGVGEQVAQGRPLRAAGRVEREGALGHGDQRGPGDDRLRHRGERPGARSVPPRRNDVAPDPQDEGDIEGEVHRAAHAVASGASLISLVSLILRRIRA